jgi:hypothetical protein
MLGTEAATVFSLNVKCFQLLPVHWLQMIFMTTLLYTAYANEYVGLHVVFVGAGT